MTSTPPTHIVIAGGGVAAVETVAALRALAGPLPRITVLAPDPQLTQRAASVATPFGFGAPTPLPFAEIARRAVFASRVGTLAAVEADARVAVTANGQRLAYDILVVAVRARTRPAVEGAITFAGVADAPAVTAALQDAGRIAFVVPFASGWSLPVYELAIMAAVERREAEITVVTAEPAPLWIFGDEASDAIRTLLTERGIALRTGARAVAAQPGKLELADGPPLPMDHVVALPRMIGQAIPGLPHDGEGFIPVDAHGAVRGVADVYAAGDATAFPLKQGGLAAQQADAAAEAIAAGLGAPVTPAPFRPVLRGLLLTGGAPLYLRAQVGGGAATSRRLSVASVSRRALWWPPAKVAGRYLAPLLATARPPVLAAAPLQDLPARPHSEDAEDALELTLLLAREDAAAGDYAQALHALDAAVALAGGALPAEWAERRDTWLAALA
jgi:sulfide:quinone oxidoreductase